MMSKVTIYSSVAAPVLRSQVPPPTPPSATHSSVLSKDCAAPAPDQASVVCASRSAFSPSSATHALRVILRPRPHPLPSPSATISNGAGAAPVSTRATSKPLVSSSRVWNSSMRKHGHPICQHFRRLSICADCGGKALCIHGKQRNWCLECGGRAKCSHGLQKSRCKECGGTSK